MSFKFTVSRINSEEYKLKPNLNIDYGKTETKYGTCLIAMNEDNVCFVYFGDYNSAINNLKLTFPNANLCPNDNLVAEKAQYFNPNSTGNIKLLLKGTDFQMQVWEYLLTVPSGTTTSYEEVAKGINNPKAIRAVSNAVGKNNIAFFVPCHRVISKGGGLSKYKWGAERKRTILTDEKAI